MSVSGRYSVSIDTLTRYLFSPDFLTRNPRFVPLQPTFAECRDTYQKELDAAGCSCRMTSDWAKKCVGQVLEILEDAALNDHETVRQFVRFIGRKQDGDDVENFGVTILVGEKRYDIRIIKPIQTIQPAGITNGTD